MTWDSPTLTERIIDALAALILGPIWLVGRVNERRRTRFARETGDEL